MKKRTKAQDKPLLHAGLWLSTQWCPKCDARNYAGEQWCKKCGNENWTGAELYISGNLSSERTTVKEQK